MFSGRVSPCRRRLQFVGASGSLSLMASQCSRRLGAPSHPHASSMTPLHPPEAMWRQEEQTTRPILGLACTCCAAPSSPARPGLRVLQSPAAPQGNEHIRQQVAGVGAAGGKVWTPTGDTPVLFCSAGIYLYIHGLVVRRGTFSSARFDWTDNAS